MPKNLYYYRRIVAEHIEKVGLICPGFRRKPHYVKSAKDLTIDHKVPKSKGGSDKRSNLRVLCRSCNSRKHDKEDIPIPTGKSTPHPFNKD